MELSDVFSGDTLKAADLQGREVNVVIADVQLKEFKEGNKLSISFQGKKKTLVANKTNAGRIAFAYGSNTDDWIGREITLYVDMVDFQGKLVEAIRVRPPAKRPLPPQNQPQPPQHPPQHAKSVVTQRDGYAISELRRSDPNNEANDLEPIPF